MPSIAKRILVLVLLLNVVIGVAVFVTRPTAGPSFDPDTIPVKDIPAAMEALSAPFAGANLFGVSAGSEDDLRYVKAKASDPKEEAGVRATARNSLDMARTVERRTRNAAIWVLVGLLLAPVGLVVVGIGVPEIGVPLTVLAGAAVTVPQHEWLLACLVPTVLALVALLAVRGRGRR